MGSVWRRATFVFAGALVVAVLVVRFGWRWQGWWGAPIVLAAPVATAIWHYLRRPAERPLDELTSRLAEAVRSQWQRAARDRLLLESQLPIRWERSKLPIAGPPAAATGTRDGARFDPLPGLEPVKRLGAGTRRGLHAVYGGLASGRLVIAGPAGAGKSSTAILLLLDALDYRGQVTSEDERRRIPVPVMFTLQGWDPATTDADEWVVTKLTELAPFRGRNGAHEARRVLDDGRIAVFLDGLDEIGEHLRPLAIQKLSKQATFRLVLLTRTSEMLEVARENHHLVGAAAVELRPISAAAAARYLHGRLVAPAPAGWQDMVRTLTDDPASPLAQALDNPLRITLVRDAYPTGRCVEELLETARFPTPAEVENHLLDLAVETAYTPRPGFPRSPYTLEVARYTLRYLAHHLDREGTRDLAWWRIPRWPRLLVRLASLCVGGVIGAATLGLVIGCLVISVFVSGEQILFSASLGLGFLVGAVDAKPGRPEGVVPFWRRSILIDERIGVKILKGMIYGFGLGFLLGFFLAMALALLFDQSLKRNLLVCCEFGLSAGAMMALVGAAVQLTQKWDDSTVSNDPREVWWQDLFASSLVGAGTFAVVGLVATVAMGLVVGESWLVNGLVVGGIAGLLMLASGIFAAEAFALFVSQVTLRIVGRPVPLRMVRFLEDARARQLLRTVGPVYQFRHANLQDRLARQY